MKKLVFETRKEMGQAAAVAAAEVICSSIENNGKANIILATGNSQFEMLDVLVKIPDINWSKVTMFHLDEYIGLAETHPASFRKYLKERFVAKVHGLKAAHFVDGENHDPEVECDRLGCIIKDCPVDVACVGIGENGHLAFNDPPADFETDKAFLVVNLDEKCRKQQMGEGWFKSLADVPKTAITMSIRQIMKSKCLIVSVPDERKAEALKASLEGKVSNLAPASIIQEHPNCTVYMDQPAAKLLSDYERA